RWWASTSSVSACSGGGEAPSPRGGESLKTLGGQLDFALHGNSPPVWVAPVAWLILLQIAELPSEFCCSLARTHLHQRCLCLREPERHVHGAVEGNGGRQRQAGLLCLAGPGVEGAEATVAMRLERTHAELFGEGEGLAVVGFSLLGIGGS